ncbi:glutathione S-transferase [Agrobacterium vitis]|uniref:MAPEG family protein n=1 Tax=Agrobacterium vitis TaxID=373 RepID=UPI0015D90F45|nr:MAPEG family protein [Agrobacterium vitis]BCH60306.1 glutathione S-transferase [Agrobacterium vitis]
MRFTVLATFMALIAYNWFFIKVARARQQFGVKAPKMTGDENFERIYRVQQNTAEQLVFFLPSLWLFGFYLSDQLAGLLGLCWTGARVLYAAEYYADAKKRGPGALISWVTAFLLLMGGTVAALLQ